MTHSVQVAPSIRVHLIRLVLVVLLPVIVALPYLVYDAYRSERVRLERGAIQTARAMALAVDRDLTGAAAATQTLAASTSLAQDDLVTFRQQALKILPQTIGNNFVLSDSSGQQLINTLKPADQALPRISSELIQRQGGLIQLFANNKPFISNVINGLVLQRPVVSVNVPVMRAGQLVYVLSIVILPERLAQLLHEQQLPANWQVAIYDRSGIIAARTHQPEKFVGQRLAPAMYKIKDMPEGAVEMVSLQNTPIFACFSRSNVSQWGVVLGVPQDELLAGLKRSVAAVLVALALLLLTCLALARLMGQRIAQSVRALIEPSKVLGSGAVVRVPQLNVLEANEVGNAITMASELIEKHSHALAQSEQRFRQLYEKAPLPYQSLNIEANILEVNEAWLELLGYTRDEVIGRFIGDFLTETSVQTLGCEFPRFTAGTRVDGPEFDLICKSGEHKRVTINGRIARDNDGNFQRTHCILTDITERKQAQTKLQMAASVFTHADEGIAITDRQGIIVEVNDAFCRITGYSRAQAVGQNPRILKSGRQAPVFYAAMWHDLTERGHWRGEIWNRRQTGEIFAARLSITVLRDEAGNAEHFVGMYADITTLKNHQTEIEHIAHFDALTNLPNRLLLADRLQQAMAQAQRRNQKLALLYLDLDGFKAINDQHGHAVGDQVLVTLAQRMKAALRDGDTLARLGGDEFVVVLNDLENTPDCLPLVKRLLALAAQPIQADAVELNISASIGIAFYPQALGVEADQLVRQADQAMYLAKVAGKNRYQIFDTEQDSHIRSQHENTARIELALQHDEFVLYYQPKVNMQSGMVMGAEALIRWQHPEQGLLAPASFLPLIEDHPLAVDVGEWVIDTALHQLEQWQAAGLDLTVSVNVGARQLQQDNFVERLQSLLQAHPLVQPQHLEIEVLETSALQDLAQMSRVIQACSLLGVTFAMDDFGTGYSSLTYLKQLHVDVLKIDQSFVRDMLDDPDDLAILKGVIGLASAFKRQVIAEGVETVAHGRKLLELGCELAQGYGIARPMPADQFAGWMSSWLPDLTWRAQPEPQ